MYKYDHLDNTLVRERAAQFRGQVARRISGELSEDEFKPLRLRNGLYLQLHSYMLRVAIPYGLLSSSQMRALARIARRYDRGYGHFTTRQNIQFNWVSLENTADILDDLAAVEMHAIQTSGNCIRNTTTDQFAGVAADEIEDPRPWAEIIRQWSTLHPEFSFLPRKFKIAINGAPSDRAAIAVHDIGLSMLRGPNGETGFTVWVGGGLGRTPMLAKPIRDFLPGADLLSYLEAILRVFNIEGRRDNLYKSRIKILVSALGIDRFRDLVEAEWAHIRDSALRLDESEIARIRARFAPPPYDANVDSGQFAAKRFEDAAFARWSAANLFPHKQPGYAAVTVSLKPVGGIPGDMNADRMDALADLADEYSHGEIRVTHRQNLVLAHVRQDRLFDLWRALDSLELATPNLMRVTDIIACPGLDFCGLATARSIPVAQRLSARLAEIDERHDLGELTINISGCINSCAHHHVGHIGILGLEKAGAESYQVTLGGSSAEDASIGKIIGRGFGADEIVAAIETIIVTWLELRHDGERFLDSLRRVGQTPFRDALYGQDSR
ncbi:MAG: nitrite/sulfite reductase, partial [Alphaproteobacteria bacterium]|nr:nitrite/sulfite reductase [Alphaproteobacteria bacterium]